MLHSQTVSASVLASLLALAGCDGSSSADAGPADASPPLEMSELFGACQQDWQCPGEGALCRRDVDGYPGGSCTLPCVDRTLCDSRGVYHHCVQREGEEVSYCERRCLNGIDCGREGYTCIGELPPSGGVCIGVCASDDDCVGGTRCNTYSSQCVEGEPPTEGGATGDPCLSEDDCLSGQCVRDVGDTGPTGWVGGYCVGDCILPSGYNNNDFFAGDTLPAGTCAGDAICYPAGGQSRGDLGRCLDACTTAADCRGGYTCLKDISLASGGTSTYNNGLCVPGDCAADGCPAGHSCITVAGSDGQPRNLCAPG